jgi:hypothetical protein
LDELSTSKAAPEALEANVKNALNHVKFQDVSVPRRNGIGGAHDINEFNKSVTNIVKREPIPNVPGVEKIEYQIPTLDRAGNPTGEFNTKLYTKTVYDPQVWTDDKLTQAVVEAVTDAVNKGQFNREWIGVTKEGYPIRGFQENGQITTFFFDH